MNLVIDQGNSLTKVALFEQERLVWQATQPEWSEEELLSLVALHGATQGIYATVRREEACYLPCLRVQMQQMITFNHTTPLPLTVNYRTPSTLGLDRVAALVGAQLLQPQRTSLVIDAGTAITYDLLVEGEQFVGGNIAPGMQMRLQALHHFTGRLPLVDSDGETPLLGVDTTTAIRAGVVQGIVYEIEGYIAILQQKYPDLFVFLTGGDAFLFATKLKSTIFAEDNLVLKGLNRILSYNV